MPCFRFQHQWKREKRRIIIASVRKHFLRHYTKFSIKLPIPFKEKILAFSPIFKKCSFTQDPPRMAHSRRARAISPRANSWPGRENCPFAKMVGKQASSAVSVLSSFIPPHQSSSVKRVTRLFSLLPRSIAVCSRYDVVWVDVFSTLPNTCTHFFFHPIDSPNSLSNWSFRSEQDTRGKKSERTFDYNGKSFFSFTSVTDLRKRKKKTFLLVFFFFLSSP